MKNKIKNAIIDQIDYLHNGEGLETDEIIDYLREHDFTIFEPAQKVVLTKSLDGYIKDRPHTIEQFRCPKCAHIVINSFHDNFCGNCGTRIDWTGTRWEDENE